MAAALLPIPEVISELRAGQGFHLHSIARPDSHSKDPTQFARRVIPLVAVAFAVCRQVVGALGASASCKTCHVISNPVIAVDLAAANVAAVRGDYKDGFTSFAGGARSTTSLIPPGTNLLSSPVVKLR